MIDNLALGLSHGLMMLAAFLLLKRPDLDVEPSPRDAPAPPAKPTKPDTKPDRGRGPVA